MTPLRERIEGLTRYGLARFVRDVITDQDDGDCLKGSDVLAGVAPQTARVVDLLANGKVRLEKVSGCGKARFRTMKLENLHKHHELVSQ